MRTKKERWYNFLKLMIRKIELTTDRKHLKPKKMKNNNHVPKIELSGRLSGSKATKALKKIYEYLLTAIGKGHTIIIGSNHISASHNHILIMEN